MVCVHLTDEEEEEDENQQDELRQCRLDWEMCEGTRIKNLHAVKPTSKERKSYIFDHFDVS